MWTPDPLPIRPSLPVRETRVENYLFNENRRKSTIIIDFKIRNESTNYTGAKSSSRLNRMKGIFLIRFFPLEKNIQSTGISVLSERVKNFM